MNIRNALICAALAFAPGCSKSSPDALMGKMVDMMEEMAKAVDAAGGDCGKMADSLAPIMKSHEGDMKAIKEMEGKMKDDKAASEALEKKYGPRMEKAMGPMMGGMMKCADDPKMKDLNAKMKDMM
jgi:hypothetical protein